MMADFLTIIAKKKRQEAIVQCLQRFNGVSLPAVAMPDRLAWAFSLKWARSELAEVVLTLLWLTEDKRLFDLAAMDLLIDNRWERQKWQQAVRKRAQMEQKMLLQAIRRDLRALTWQRPLLDITGFAAFATPSLRRQMMVLGREEWLALAEEKERAAFVEVLQSFVQMQEPMAAVAHVWWQDDDFIIRDEQRRDLKKVYEAALLLEQQSIDDATGEDLLLSILITIVPKRVVLHGERSRAPDLTMVETVFADRLTWCSEQAFDKQINFER